MDDSTLRTFGCLDKLPSKVRCMIFTSMVQNAIQVQFRNIKSTSGLDILAVRSHLESSLWINYKIVTVLSVVLALSQPSSLDRLTSIISHSHALFNLTTQCFP